MMLVNVKTGYFQHKTSEDRMNPAEFNLKCPYDEMDQWQYHDHDGHLVSDEEMQAQAVAFLRLFAEKDPD